MRWLLLAARTAGLANRRADTLANRISQLFDFFFLFLSFQRFQRWQTGLKLHIPLRSLQGQQTSPGVDARRHSIANATERFHLNAGCRLSRLLSRIAAARH